MDIELVSLLILIACVATKSLKSDGFYAAHCIFWVYAANVLFGTSELGIAIEENSFFYLQTLYALIVIYLLQIRVNRLSVCLIAVYVGYIFTHMLGMWLEGYGNTALYFYSTILLFAVEVILLMSERVTNGCYRSLEGAGVFRFSFDNSNQSASSSKGET